MGIISDAIDALEDWCKDLFKDGIQSQFDGISDLLTDTFSQTTGTGGSGGLVNDFVTQHPSQFTGGGTGGTTIWTTIETLCNNVVVPIGGFILTVILLNELIQMVLRGNNFKADFEIGNAYGAVWGMNILAGELPDEILKDFLEMQNLFCVNIHVDPLDQIDALKFVKKKLTNVEQMKIDEQKKASQSGYDPDILPPAIKMYIEDIEKLLGDLNSKNERLFHISISLRAYAKSKKDLKLLSEMLKRTCQKNNCIMFPYDYRQEQTLVSTLPIGYNEIPVRREMHTSGIAIFVPFTTKELFQDGQATYYGINTLSGNMIRANRSRLKNPNGLILGTISLYGGCVTICSMRFPICPMKRSLTF